MRKVTYTPRSELNRINARNRAKVRLSVAHPKIYQKLYEEEFILADRGSLRIARLNAINRARKRLADRFPTEFKQYFQEELEKLEHETN